MCIHNALVQCLANGVELCNQGWYTLRSGRHVKYDSPVTSRQVSPSSVCSQTEIIQKGLVFSCIPHFKWCVQWNLSTIPLYLGQLFLPNSNTLLYDLFNY